MTAVVLPLAVETIFLNNQRKHVPSVDGTTKFQTFSPPPQIHLSSRLVVIYWNPLTASPSNRVFPLNTTTNRLSCLDVLNHTNSGQKMTIQDKVVVI